MNPTLASLAIALALATSVSAAQAETVWRFPHKGGAPYALQLPDRPSTTVRQKTIDFGSVRMEQRNGRRVVRLDR